jgi:hypothetical protein
MKCRKSNLLRERQRAASQSAETLVARSVRLYEQGADSVRIGEYVRRWLVWARSGLVEDAVCLPTALAMNVIRMPGDDDAAIASRQAARVQNRTA